MNRPDDHPFQATLQAARHLVNTSLVHERRLQQLLEVIEEQAPGSLVSVSLASSIRELCAAAQDQRRRGQELLLTLLDDAGTRADSGRRRVLIVDDCEETRDIVAVVLRRAGLAVATASNGLEALIAAHNMHPAVIVMDVTMPVLDGIEATRLLKAGPTTRDAHVIAHTARREFSHGQATRLFAHVLSKPAAPDAILASVLRFIDAGDGARSTR